MDYGFVQTTMNCNESTFLRYGDKIHPDCVDWNSIISKRYLYDFLRHLDGNIDVALQKNNTMRLGASTPDNRWIDRAFLYAHGGYTWRYGFFRSSYVTWQLYIGNPELVVFNHKQFSAILEYSKLVELAE